MTHVDALKALRDQYARVIMTTGLPLPCGWQMRYRAAKAFNWMIFSRADGVRQHQGWKVHISCAAIEGPILCQKVIPLLLRHNMPFKLPATIDGLLYINSGLGGETQIGKIVTIYTSDEHKASALLQELRYIWPNSRGPIVASEWQLKGADALSLRYGSFGGNTMVDSTGAHFFTLMSPNGIRERDKSRLDRVSPSWIPAPPVADIYRAFVVNEQIEVSGQTYVPVARLQHSPKSDVTLCTSLQTCEAAVVKTVRAGVCGDAYGRDARDLINNEYHILLQLNTQEIGPLAIGFTRSEQAAAIAIEAISGITLDRAGREVQSRLLANFARCLARVHSIGVIHRDVKLSNAIVTGDSESVVLIDFELASAPYSATPFAGGTNGYIPPEGVSAPPGTTYDSFALGACIAHVFLAYDPSGLAAGAGRLTGLLILLGRHDVAMLVKRLTHVDPQMRVSPSEAAVAIDSLPQATSNIVGGGQA